MLQFLILIPRGSGLTAPFSFNPSSGTKPQYHLQAGVVKIQVSYFCGLTAIIQKLWETAWDLLAHFNVELLGSGFGLSIFLHHCPGPSLPSHITTTP